MKIMRIIFFIKNKKAMKYLSTNTRQFFWLQESSRSLRMVCYRLPPTRPSAIMWSWKCIIKVRVKEQICWLRGMKSFFASKNVRDFFFLVHSTSNNSLFSCPTTRPSAINVQHIFCRYADWKLFFFISTKFSTHHTECTGLPTGLLIHEMKSSYIILIPFFLHSFHNSHMNLNPLRTRSGMKSDWRDGHRSSSWKCF